MKKEQVGGGPAIAAEFVDKSVYNLSSIVVLAESGGKTHAAHRRRPRRLHPRRAAQGRPAQERKPLHVDLLKLPHHGSDRNVTSGLLRQITADHYVISADGSHGNPDPTTLGMLTRARGAAEYTIHLTDRVDAAETFFQQDRPQGRRIGGLSRRRCPSVTVAIGG